jgi:hypothetical protein
VGGAVGINVGWDDGLNEGAIVGLNVGIVLGLKEGVVLGLNEGSIEGLNEGVVLGLNVGFVLGLNEGFVLGLMVGSALGSGERFAFVLQVYGRILPHPASFHLPWLKRMQCSPVPALFGSPLAHHRYVAVEPESQTKVPSTAISFNPIHVASGSIVRNQLTSSWDSKVAR